MMGIGSHGLHPYDLSQIPVVHGNSSREHEAINTPCYKGILGEFHTFLFKA